MPDDIPEDSGAFEVLRTCCEALRATGYTNFEVASALITLTAGAMVETREEYDRGEGYEKAIVIMKTIRDRLHEDAGVGHA